MWNQSVVPCPVLTVASWPAYRFLKRQVRWSGIPIFQNFPQFIVIHTQRVQTMSWKAAASHSSLTRSPLLGRVSSWAMFCGLYFGHHDVEIILTTPKYSQKSCAVLVKRNSIIWVSLWSLTCFMKIICYHLSLKSNLSATAVFMKFTLRRFYKDAQAAFKWE